MIVADIGIDFITKAAQHDSTQVQSGQVEIFVLLEGQKTRHPLNNVNKLYRIICNHCMDIQVTTVVYLIICYSIKLTLLRKPITV